MNRMLAETLAQDFLRGRQKLQETAVLRACWVREAGACDVRVSVRGGNAVAKTKKPPVGPGRLLRVVAVKNVSGMNPLCTSPVTIQGQSKGQIGQDLKRSQRRRLFSVA